MAETNQVLKRLTKWTRVRRKGNEKLGPLSFMKLMGQKKIAENSESLKKKIRKLNSKKTPSFQLKSAFLISVLPRKKNHIRLKKKNQQIRTWYF